MAIWFIKRNESSVISLIEQKVYQALKDHSQLTGIGVPKIAEMPDDHNTFLVENCGRTLVDYLHSGEYSSTEEMRIAFEGYLESSSKARAVVNETISVALTPEEKDFLQEYHHQKLRTSLIPLLEREVGEEEMKTHYWAYRAMNALGISDLSFRDTYTRLIGSQLGAYTKKFGSWLSDNTLRNNASPDGKSVVPFDFNSLKYGPRQIDEAAVAGLFLIDGPLGIYKTLPEIQELTAKLQFWAGREEEPEYLRAFLLCAFHENAVIAGYRAKEAEEKFKAIREEVAITGRASLAFHKAFDEIEYHHDVPVLLVREIPDLLVNSEDYNELQKLSSTITQRSFLRRSVLLVQPEFRAVSEMAHHQQDLERKVYNLQMIPQH